MRSILAAGVGAPQPREPGQALVLEFPVVPTRSLDDYAVTATTGEQPSATELDSTELDSTELAQAPHVCGEAELAASDLLGWHVAGET